MNDSRARPCSVTLEEKELRLDLLNRNITFATYTRRYNKLKKKGLIKRSGKVTR